MPGVLDLAQGVLPPTATYARREWRWVPCAPAAGADGREGTLTIILQRAERRRRRRPVVLEVDHYGVQEDFADVPPAGAGGSRARAFLLANDAPAAEGDELYRCVVGGMAEACTCLAGDFDRRRRGPTGCKHRDALAAMLKEGVI